MKKILFCVLLSCFLCADVRAGEYSGLTPGVSTQSDAQKELGRPIRILSNGNRMDYSSEGHDLKRLSISYQGSSGVIQGIDLFFKEGYKSDQLKEWFGLEEKSHKRVDGNGNRVEYYKEKGIELHFGGPEMTDSVIFLRHRVPDFKNVEQKEKLIVKNNADSESCPASAAKFADQADAYIQKDQYGKAIPHLKKAAMCDSDKVVYASMLAFSYFQDGQLNKAIEEAKKTIERKEDYIAYSVLGTAYFRKNDCRSAIPYLEKAVTFKEDKKLIDNLEFLGICYYNDGRLNEALTTMVKANKRRRKSPVSVYYLGAISDRLGNQADARDFYKRYLRLRHDNEDMNFAAKERLSVLNRQSTQKSKKSLSDLIGVFTKEMKDFNSE